MIEPNAELYESRGREPEQDAQEWLREEQEIFPKQVRTIATATCRLALRKRRRETMDCLKCMHLEQVFEARAGNFSEARSSAFYQLSTELAAKKQVDMERARNDLEEHQSTCAWHTPKKTNDFQGQMT